MIFCIIFYEYISSSIAKAGTITDTNPLILLVIFIIMEGVNGLIICNSAQIMVLTDRNKKK